MSDWKPGDRVKVTIEAEVVGEMSPSGACLCSLQTNGGRIREGYLRQNGVTVEKIEPPVKAFEPGDVVIRKHDNAPILLTSDGYVYLRGNARGQYYSYNGTGYPREHFTSDRYARAKEYKL